MNIGNFGTRTVMAYTDKSNMSVKVAVSKTTEPTKFNTNTISTDILLPSTISNEKNKDCRDIDLALVDSGSNDLKPIIAYIRNGSVDGTQSIYLKVGTEYIDQCCGFEYDEYEFIQSAVDEVINCVEIVGFKKDNVNGFIVLTNIDNNWVYKSIAFDNLVPGYTFSTDTNNVIAELEDVSEVDLGLLVNNPVPPSTDKFFNITFAYRLNDDLLYLESDITNDGSGIYTLNDTTGSIVIDSSNETGYYPSINTLPIKFNGVDINVPHVAYYSKNGSSVKYAIREYPTGDWKAFSVNNYKNESDIITSISLTQTCLNEEVFRPIISYYNCGAGRLEIAHGVYGNDFVANDWKLTTTCCMHDSGDCVSANIIDIGNNGEYPAVAYYNKTLGQLELTVSESQKGYPWKVDTLSYLVASGSDFNVDADDDIGFVFNPKGNTTNADNLKLDELF